MVFFASLKTLCFFDCGRLYILQNYSKKHTKKWNNFYKWRNPPTLGDWCQETPRVTYNSLGYPKMFNEHFPALEPTMKLRWMESHTVTIQIIQHQYHKSSCIYKEVTRVASHSPGRTWKRLAGSRMDCLTLWPHHNISLSWCFIQSYESYVTWHHLYVFCLTKLVLATLYKFMHVNHVQIYGFICSCIAHLNDGLPQSGQFPLCSPSLWTSAFLSSSSPYGTGEPCVINHKLQ